MSSLSVLPVLDDTAGAQLQPQRTPAWFPAVVADPDTARCHLRFLVMLTHCTKKTELCCLFNVTLTLSCHSAAYYLFAFML